nr:lytic transglycosylase domain-containing protein [Vibrio sp. D431a]
MLSAVNAIAAPIYSNYPWTSEHSSLYVYAHEHKGFIVDNGYEKYKNYLKYRDHIREITDKYRVPKEVVIVAAIESSFVADAKSRAGAVGMWQFMPATARDVGLEVNKRTDERLDWKKSTEAAAKYLKWLADQFGGDYETAILAYNYGIGNVKRISNQIKSREAFKIIDSGKLPKESEEYLLKFLTYLHYFNYLDQNYEELYE